jgi:tRNA (guanine37-N1)-methyltransferase
VREHLVDEELSVGDVVLSGGEVAACLVGRGRRPSAARARWATRPARSPRASANRACSRSRTTHARRNSGAGPCPTRCAAVTTPGSIAGAVPSPLHRTLRYRPDLVEAAGGLGELDRRLLEEFPPVTYP